MKDHIAYEVSGWGETDFPEVRFAFDLEGVREAVAELMFCPVDDDGRKEAAEICEDLDESTELPWTVEFEQGGLQVRKVIAWLPSADQNKGAAPEGWDAEFLAKRLGRVARLVGVPIPERMTYEQIAEVAGTILGQIAGALEFQKAKTHTLQRLGARLAELLDEDHWAECERMLLEAGIQPSNSK